MSLTNSIALSLPFESPRLSDFLPHQISFGKIGNILGMLGFATDAYVTTSRPSFRDPSQAWSHRFRLIGDALSFAGSIPGFGSAAKWMYLGGLALTGTEVATAWDGYRSGEIPWWEAGLRAGLQVGLLLMSAKSSRIDTSSYKSTHEPFNLDIDSWLDGLPPLPPGHSEKEVLELIETVKNSNLRLDHKAAIVLRIAGRHSQTLKDESVREISRWAAPIPLSGSNNDHAIWRGLFNQEVTPGRSSLVPEARFRALVEPYFDRLAEMDAPPDEVLKLMRLKYGDLPTPTWADPVQARRRHRVEVGNWLLTGQNIPSANLMISYHFSDSFLERNIGLLFKAYPEPTQNLAIPSFICESLRHHSSMRYKHGILNRLMNADIGNEELARVLVRANLDEATLGSLLSANPSYNVPYFHRMIQKDLS